MIRTCRVVLVFALAAGAAVTAQQPARDNVVAAKGTASISGIVFEAGEPRRPARRVRVTLNSLERTAPGQTITTDDNGTFNFSGLPAGRFELQAFKPAWLRASFGAARPDRTGTPIVVKDGEAVTQITMTIVRGGVISGAVLDTRGRPVPGMSVRVLRLAYNGVTGERTLSTPSGSSVSALTDDRGEYRAYGLPPGSYFVLVPPPSPGGRSNDPIRQLTSEQVRQALQSARSTTSTAPGAATSAPVITRASHITYAPIFHPGTTDVATAVAVPLSLSEQRSGIDVTIQLVPTATISGTITSPTGQLPPMLQVRLVPTGPQPEMLAGAGLRGVTAQIRPDGTFVFPGVAPGNYVVRAMVGWSRTGPSAGPTQWAASDVSVNGDDLSVHLALQPGVPVTGRVVFEGTQPPTPAELQGLAFTLMPPASGGELQSLGGGGKVDASGLFVFPNVVPDLYRYAYTWGASSAGDKWTIKSAVANGREAFEAPLRVLPNEPVEWTITFTDRPATLTGGLQEEGGRAATEYYILVFSTNRAHWTPGSRRIRMTRAGSDGTYTVKGLPAGEYFLAALLDLETGEWNDPTLLDRLVKSSVRVILRDGETTTQHFRMGGGNAEGMVRGGMYAWRHGRRAPGSQ